MEVPREQMEEMIRDIVREEVKPLDTKLDEHIKRVEPYLQGAAGLGLVWKALVALGAGVLIVAQIKGNLFK